MSPYELLEQARIMVSEHHADFGKLVRVEGMTWDASAKKRVLPYTEKATGVPVSVASITSIRDSTIATVLQRTRITIERFRRITVAVGSIEFAEEDILTEEPVTPSSDRYIVKEVVAADETSQIEITLHCEILSSGGA